VVVYIIIYYTFCCQLFTANVALFVDKNISVDNAASSFRVDVL